MTLSGTSKSASLAALAVVASALALATISTDEAKAYNFSPGIPAPTVQGVPSASRGYQFIPNLSATTNSLVHVEFFCQIDGAAIYDCTGSSDPTCVPFTAGQHTCSASVVQGRLPEGVHMFEFRTGLCDQVLRIDCATENDWFLGEPHVASIVFDYTAPVATILKRNAAPTTSRPLLKRKKPVFEFSSSEPGTFECRLGNTVLGPCTSPYVLDYPLKNKTYQFRVIATDGSGNFSRTAVKSFAVDIFEPKNCSRKKNAAKTKCKRQNAAAKKRWKRKHNLR